MLAPGGRLLLTCHLGRDSLHLDEWFEAAVDVDFHFFTRDEMAGCLRAASFDVAGAHERDPYGGVEADTRRAYFLAVRP